MIKKVLIALIVVFAGISCFYIEHTNQNRVQPIKKVYLTRKGDVHYFCIDFEDGVRCAPRVHTLRKGIKVIISCDEEISPPAAHKIDNEIVDGYFFDQFGASSLMIVALFKGRVSYVEKKYTKNSLKIGFKVRKSHTIVIDAGHGGKDPGTRSVTGDYEKNITLVMAAELRNTLKATERYDVVMTRDGDEFIPREARIEKIKNSSSEILISLHTDSNNDKNVRGISVYTLPDSIIKRNSPQKYIQNLNISRKFANILVGYIPNMCKIKHRPCRNAELKVLKSGIPAVLIELGCVSNWRDNALLHSREFRDKTNRAILYALDKLFHGNPK